jgi:hypothetical protein
MNEVETGLRIGREHVIRSSIVVEDAPLEHWPKLESRRGSIGIGVGLLFKGFSYKIIW